MGGSMYGEPTTVGDLLDEAMSDMVEVKVLVHQSGVIVGIAEIELVDDVLIITTE